MAAPPPKWSRGSKYPNFSAPLAGQKVIGTNATKDKQMRNAIWQLFWQKSVEEQVACFQERPLLGIWVTNEVEQRPDCIRDPITGAPIRMTIKCRFTRAMYKKFLQELKDPYHTATSYRECYGRRVSGDWFQFQFEVGKISEEPRDHQTTTEAHNMFHHFVEKKNCY